MESNAAVRTPLRLTAVFAALFTASGCRPANVLNAFVPEDGYRVERAIAYGEGPRRKLDLYVPLDRSEPRPVIVFFYGGSWQNGSRADYRFVGEAFASRGWLVVIPDYRLYPEVRYPGFVEDGALAVAWTKQNIDAFGGNPDRIVVMGHSAGAHIAAMLAYDPSFLEAAGAPGPPAAFVGLAGPYDFLPARDPAIRAIFDVENPERSQPLAVVGPAAPPSLLLHGADDVTVSPGNAERLSAKLEALDVPVTHIVYPHTGHIGIAVALASPFRWLAPVVDDTDAFLDRLVIEDGGSDQP